MSRSSASRSHRARLPFMRRFLTVTALCLGLAAPQSATAWDPTTTHLGMVDRAVLESALHLRWMAASELQRGLFTPLRVDPARLSPGERRFLGAALTHAPTGAGVQPLGGPGACPGPKAPPATQLYCVEGDVWEMPAVQWLQLGVLAELVPSARAVHHFVDRDDPSRLTFNDPQQRPLVLRSRQFRHNGAPLAGYITGTSFAGTGPSAIAWLADESDPLAPPRTFAHLELASTHPEPRARDHHLAMALIGFGALLHVLQDMSVPAHARGDVTAFFTAISDIPGDRGLPLNEIARLSFGRHALPGHRDLESIREARGTGLTGGLRGHFLGDAAYEGLAVFTGRRFLSEHSVPEPRFLEPDLDAEKAAAALLTGADLDASEIKGAVLSPWPAERGYIKTVTGRPIAAFDTDDLGRVRPYIDEAVYREQFAQLIPRAVEASRSLIDWMWPTWPEILYDASAGHLDLAIAADLQNPELLVFTQTAEGQRTVQQKVRLRPGIRNRVQNLPKLQEDARTVVVLRARRASGELLILEQALGAESKTFAVVPPPYVAPPPPLPPEPSEVAPAPDSTDPDATDPDATDPAATEDTTNTPDAPVTPAGKSKPTRVKDPSKPAAPTTPSDTGKPSTPTDASKPATNPSTPATSNLADTSKPAAKPSTPATSNPPAASKPATPTSSSAANKPAATLSSPASKPTAPSTPPKPAPGK